MRCARRWSGWALFSPRRRARREASEIKLTRTAALQHLQQNKDRTCHRNGNPNQREHKVSRVISRLRAMAARPLLAFGVEPPTEAGSVPREHVSQTDRHDGEPDQRKPEVKGVAIHHSGI